MAWCAWEVDVDLESDSDSSNHEEPVEAQDELKSFWSKDSDAEMDFAKLSVPNLAWEQYSSCNATWTVESSIRSPSPSLMEPLKIYESPRTPPSTYSPQSPDSSPLPSAPATPESVMCGRPTPTLEKGLKINTGCGRRIFFTGSSETRSTFSSMHTAVESSTPFSSIFLCSCDKCRLMSPKGRRSIS